MEQRGGWLWEQPPYRFEGPMGQIVRELLEEAAFDAGGRIFPCVKIPYASAASAQSAAEKIKRSRLRTLSENRRAGLSVYHCTHCGGWHLGRLDKLSAAAAQSDIRRKKAFTPKKENGHAMDSI